MQKEMIESKIPSVAVSFRRRGRRAGKESGMSTDLVPLRFYCWFEKVSKLTCRTQDWRFSVSCVLNARVSTEIVSICSQICVGSVKPENFLDQTDVQYPYTHTPNKRRIINY